MTGPRGMVSALLILSSATLFSNSELILGIGFSIILVTSVIVLFIPLLPKPKFFKEAEIKKRTEPTPGIENNTLNQEAKNIVKKAQKKVDNSQILKTR